MTVLFMPPNTTTSQVLSDNDLALIDDLGQLEAMKIWQGELSEVCGCGAFSTEDLLRDTVAQLAVEASEALAPFLTKTKPWKDPIPDLNHIDEEIIDVLHFVLTYFNVREISGNQMVEAYRRKNLRNFERVSEKMGRLH